MKGYKLCKYCGCPILKKGQRRKNPDDYRHARGSKLIAPDIREAWKWAQCCPEGFRPECHLPSIFSNAYVEEAWQRRRAEFRLFHVTCDYWDKPTDQGGAFQTRWKCMDLERHNWTNEQWREEVVRELRAL